MNKKNRQNFLTAWGSLSLIFFLVPLLAACSPQSASPTEEPPITVTMTGTEPEATPTSRPTSTPTPAPLGSTGNPIIMGFVLTPEQTNEIEPAEDLAFLLTQESEFSVESAVFPDFASLESAIKAGSVHLAWLGPFEYLYLNKTGAVDVMIMTNHLGVYAYGVKFLANVTRGFTTYFDPNTNQSIGDPIAAMQQFSGTRPCFLESNSIPGYYVPLGLLANASTPTLEPIFTFSYNAIIRALYIQGICDFGVSYALIGDPRNSNDILQNIPEAQSEIIVIWQSEGIIPNTNLSAAQNLPLNIRFQIQEAFIRLSQQSTALSLLSTALSYDVEALRTQEDSFYNPLRTVIESLELDLQNIINPPSQE